MARVLVIDDDPTIRQLMARMLTMEGYEVLDAFDGEDGIQQFQENDVDLIVTDWEMPRKDGGDVIREVRRREPAAKIIVVTAHQPAITAAMELGVHKVLPKPFDLQQLIDGVEDELGKEK